MKRIVYLAAAVLVAMLILVPTALAQGTTAGPLPASGGPAITSVLLPAAALLLGSGVLVYAILRRR